MIKNAGGLMLIVVYIKGFLKQGTTAPICEVPTEGIFTSES